VFQCVVVCCSVLQCVAVCCSVLQCVAVCSLRTYDRPPVTIPPSPPPSSGALDVPRTEVELIDRVWLLDKQEAAKGITINACEIHMKRRTVNVCEYACTYVYIMYINIHIAIPYLGVCAVYNFK